MYLSDEIDETATRRKLDEITSTAMHRLGEHAERSARIDGRFREGLDRQQAEARAMDKLIVDAHARQAAERAKADPPSPWVKREAKPTVMSIGGEEFTDPAATTPVPKLPPAAATLPVPILPEPPPAPPAGSEDRPRVLSLGYAGEEDASRDRPAPVPPPPPAARRDPARRPPEEDDDLSGRRWMR
jgi:hypothetical protein